MVKRIVSFKDAARAYALTYDSLAIHRASDEETAFNAITKLQSIGVERERRPDQNPDLTLYSLDPAANPVIELLESEVRLILEAVGASSWPTFALDRKRQIIAILRNAETREIE